jgi:hypothetical protein
MYIDIPCVGLADVAPVKRGVPCIPSDAVVCPCLQHPTMVEDGDHLPVELHNSNYSKSRWERRENRENQTSQMQVTDGTQITKQNNPAHPKTHERRTLLFLVINA